MDDKIDGFHYYFRYLKFGLGRCTSDVCLEIRDGHLSRKEGIKLVEKYDYEFPKKHFKEFLEYCDLSKEDFAKICDSWRGSHIRTKKNNTWKLKHTVDQKGEND